MGGDWKRRSQSGSGKGESKRAGWQCSHVAVHGKQTGSGMNSFNGKPVFMVVFAFMVAQMDLTWYFPNSVRVSFRTNDFISVSL